ncbi:MAG TPA: OmpA family protein [Rhodanobacteraceae bacterium]|nr:OmpA family protein [Rhodanobacteraceae bacterium]
MANSPSKYLALTVSLLAAGALAACGSLSRGITKDGTHAQQLVWAKPADTSPLHRGGTYPNLENLRQVQAGLNKNQIIALIGPPHFSEGFAGVHEWNYLFDFRSTGGTVTECEYKVLFDQNMIARSFYWHPSTCADVLNPPAKIAPPEVERFTLSADALFAFDKWKLSDIKPDGRAQLDALARKLVAAKVRDAHVHVIGYTDRLGGQAYNQTLSERRAATVRAYLVSRGVVEGHIDAEGRGEADPVKNCDDSSRAMLIACLAPNRRVVVEAKGMH